MEIPHELSISIAHSLVIDSWFEHLPTDERPPEWMWPLPWEVEQWFDRVEKERDKKYGSSGDGTDDNIVEPDLEPNVYAEALRQG